MAAVGKAEMIRGDWIRPGAVVIDAGYNKVEGRKGDVGDVDFQSASAVADWITPVPGGSGADDGRLAIKQCGGCGGSDG